MSAPRLAFTLLLAVAGMDIDDQHPPHHSPQQHVNAVAGPSTIPDIPPLYLPPPRQSLLSPSLIVLTRFLQALPNLLLTSQARTTSYPSFSSSLRTTNTFVLSLPPYPRSVPQTRARARNSRLRSPLQQHLHRQQETKETMRMAGRARRSSRTISI